MTEQKPWPKCKLNQWGDEVQVERGGETQVRVMIGKTPGKRCWNDTEEGRANEGNTGQAWRENQAAEEHKNTRHTQQSEGVRKW